MIKRPFQILILFVFCSIIPKTHGQNLPRMVSLKPYCPIPQNQDKSNSCTAWASAYGALTTYRAIQQNITDKHTIQSKAYSASFVYNVLIPPLSKNPCGEAILLVDVLLFLRDSGVCLATSFPKTADCSAQPTEAARAEARLHKIETFKPAFNIWGDTASIIRDMKQLLADKKPVIVALNSTFSIHSSKNKVVWANEETGHAVLIIGYNDVEKTFEFMNSAGTNWGNAGFGTMTYQDFIQHTIQAFYFEIDW